MTSTAGTTDAQAGGRRASAACLFAVGIAVVAGCSHGAAPSVVVPDVVGLRPDRAVAEPCATGLEPGRVTIVHRGAVLTRAQSPEAVMAAARVVATLPAAGARLRSGAPVAMSLFVPRTDAPFLLSTRCGGPRPT